MKLFTIGFTKKTARDFFEILRQSQARSLIDVRLNNSSQLAGYSKRDDLAYFLEEVPRMGYAHMLELAPTQEILATYRKRERDWEWYELQFLTLMAERHIELLPPEKFVDACLLCSEAKPDFCHRRLVAEYLQRNWPDVEIVHL